MNIMSRNYTEMFNYTYDSDGQTPIVSCLYHFYGR